MTGAVLLASLLLAQSAAPVASTEGSTITARAPNHRHNGWLTSAGPDAQGRYTVWINIADLDASQAAGERAMTARLERATAVLCDISAEQPQIPGFYNRGQRQCWSGTREQALDQVTRARDAAREGRRLSTLGVSAAPEMAAR